ncbi:hypothetical protein ACPB4A_25085, partial [Escherichia coli]
TYFDFKSNLIKLKMQPKHVGENPQVMLKQIMSTARVLLKSCLNHALNSHHFPRQIQPKE